MDDLAREWLVTNGLGGYASGTVSGINTRSYHALLVASLPAPLGRMVMWSHLFERAQVGARELVAFTDCASRLRQELGLPIWSYRVGDAEIERRIFMPHLQNTVVVTYTVVAASRIVTLELEPAVDFRKHGMSVEAKSACQYTCTSRLDGCDVAAAASTLPPCRFRIVTADCRFVHNPRTIENVTYPVEKERGYTHLGELWSPGSFRIHLRRGQSVTLIGSTEPASEINTLAPVLTLAAEETRRRDLLEQAGSAADDEMGAQLVLAADQFLIRPAGRVEHRGIRDRQDINARTVIAGYHWFSDWGRDTMISLQGLTMTTRRFAEAREILLTFASYVRDGLIPNLFPDGEQDGLYHTADATLWFFHALARFLKYTDDRATLDLLLPTMIEIAEAHLRGTKFNIRVDPADGLLAQGAEGYQLTWMDAKMGDWVVTPRRGKAVELNALWYNALKLLGGWLRQTGHEVDAERYESSANQTRASFNARFWYGDGGYLFDLIDCDCVPGAVDNSCRPNQVFAISLDHAVLDQARWRSVLDVLERELVTPVGLRSLAPSHPDYRAIYSGDLRSRDGAYHQGTVWAWLIGPFVDAWLKVHRDDRAGARKFLAAFPRHLEEAGIGSISEVFHGSAPHIAGGCIAQAWSVAEVLRCWVKTEPRQAAGRLLGSARF